MRPTRQRQIAVRYQKTEERLHRVVERGGARSPQGRALLKKQAEQFREMTMLVLEDPDSVEQLVSPEVNIRLRLELVKGLIKFFEEDKEDPERSKRVAEILRTQRGQLELKLITVQRELRNQVAPSSRTVVEPQEGAPQRVRVQTLDIGVRR